MRFLTVKAGPRALAHLQSHGLAPNDVDLMLGASGGPRWLVLSHLDRYFIDWFAGRQRPLFLVGASSGAWRFGCYAQQQARAALERLEQVYVEQAYPPDPSPTYILGRCAEMQNFVLGQNGVRESLSHPYVRLNLVTALARGWAGKPDYRQGLGFGLAALANMAGRHHLGRVCPRVLFSDPRDRPVWPLDDLETHLVELTPDNLQPALVASGAIPWLIRGVRDIAGGPPGIYRDGGVIDYHFDLPFAGPGLALFAHFSPRHVPGWFDTYWPKRQPRHLDHLVMLHPSPQFVARLPFARVPDREDFYRLDDQTRFEVWRKAVEAGRWLVDEFHALVESGDWARVARPLTSK